MSWKKYSLSKVVSTDGETLLAEGGTMRGFNAPAKLIYKDSSGRQLTIRLPEGENEELPSLINIAAWDPPHNDELLDEENRSALEKKIQAATKLLWHDAEIG